MIIIVVGMHRSGTSALAGLLDGNGVYMGKGHYHPKPMRENPKGFFENREFRVINDQLLRANNYNVKSFDTNIPEVIKVPYTVERQMEELISTYSDKHPIWGFKDPRTCLTLMSWLNAAKIAAPERKVKIISIMRNNIEVAFSMQRRGNKGSLHRFATLADVYNKRARQGFWITTHMIQFKDLIYKTDETLAGISAFLGMDIANNGFIEERLANR